MCIKIFSSVYRARVAQGTTRVHALEVCLKPHLIPLSGDLRNESHNISELFSNKCKTFIDELFFETLDKLKEITYAEAQDIILMLAYLQEILALALWRYNLKPSEKLEGFCRDFDRLDEESERYRLFQFANNPRPNNEYT